MPGTNDERSLADQPADPTIPGGTLGESVVGAAAAAALGTPNSADTPQVQPPPVSIVDTILQLDSFLSGDVRRAEKTARFCSKPWIEADIDELQFELVGITDSSGPLPGMEKRASEVAMQIQTRQAEYGAAFVSVRMGQLSSDDWKAWRTKWREVIDKAGEKPDAFWDDLIEVSALRPTITAAQAAELRTKLGGPQMDELGAAAWEVNTNSGVSIPKSSLSSAVLRQAVRAQS